MGLDDDRIELILDRWEAARAEGIELTPEELCHHAPELLGAVARQTQTLASFERFDRAPSADSDSTFTIGNYQVLSALAYGATSVVYAARDDAGQPVAIKVLNPERMNRSGLARFQREAAILRRLDHPHIARIVDAGVTDIGLRPQRYLVMPLIDGEPLDRFIFSRNLPLRDRVTLLVKVARAVSAAHQSAVIHRDLKPANILVTDDGQPWLVDFGLAQLTPDGSHGDESFRTSAAFLGTLPYMSPEQALGSAETDARTDVYSLGVIAYQLLAGDLPIETRDCSFHDAQRRIRTRVPKPLSRVNDHIPRPLSTIVSTALAKDPRDRYPSMDALADDLARFLENVPILARSPSPMAQGWRLVRQHPGLAAAMTSVIVLLLMAAVVSAVFAKKANTARRDTLAALATAVEQRNEARDQQELHRRAAYNLQLSRAFRMAMTGPENAIKLLEDPVVCPPEFRDTAWGIARHFADNVFFDIPHARSFRLIRAAPESSTLVLVDDANRVMLWDILQRNVKADFQSDVLESPIRHVAIQADEQLVAVAHEDGSIRFFQPDVGVRTDFSRQLPKCPLAISFGWDNHFVVVRANHSIEMWHFGTLDVFRFHGLPSDQRIVGVEIAKRAERVAVCYADGTLVVWDLPNNKCQTHSYFPCQHMAFTSHMSQLLGLRGSIVMILDLIVHGNCVPLLFDTCSMSSLVGDSANVFAAASGERIFVHSPDRKNDAQNLSYTTPGVPVQIALTQGGEYLGVLLENGTARVYTTNPSSTQSCAHGYIGTAICEIPQRNLFAVGISDGRISLWDPVRNSMIREAKVASAPISRIVVLPDGDTLAAVSTDGRVSLFDVDEASCVNSPELQPTRACPATATLSADGGSFVFSSLDGKIFFFDLATHKVREMVAPPRAQFVAVGLIDELIAVAGHDRMISVCGYDSRVNVRRLGKVPETVDRMVPSPDGRLLAAIFHGGVHIWDVVEGQLVAEIDDLKVTATALAFSHDGKTVATICRDNSLALWDTRTGVQQISLAALRSPYASIAFSSDGRLLLATTCDGSLHSWLAAER